MAHPQIFIPNGKLDSGAELARVGLGDWHGVEESQGVPCGPGNAPGLLVSWRPGNPEQRIGYFPAEQTWIQETTHHSPLTTHSLYWIGFWNDSPPTPAELLRSAADGYWVTLGDSQRWAVPAAGLLPRNVLLTLGTSGIGAVTNIKPEYAAFSRDAERWAEYFLALTDDAPSPEFTPDMAVFAFQALAINYRLTPAIVNHCGLFDQLCVLDVLRAVIDLQLLANIQAQKKTAADSVSTPATSAGSPGAAASPPATSPPGSTP